MNPARNVWSCIIMRIDEADLVVLLLEQQAVYELN